MRGAQAPAIHWQSRFIAVASKRVIGFSPGWYGQAAGAGDWTLVIDFACVHSREPPVLKVRVNGTSRKFKLAKGVGAAEINYHGMKPANIDDLARKAAMC